MTTYADDCDLDAAKPLRSLIWKVVRTKFAAKDPVQMQKFVCVVREALTVTSLGRGTRLIKSDHKEDLGRRCRVCTTAGQSGTPPDPKLLLEQPCDPGACELIGSLLFLSRCTRFDLSFLFARLARSLIMESADDDREELRLSTFCDASFGTRCSGGYKVKLTESRGSFFLIEWASRLQGPVQQNQKQSSGDEQPKRCCAS